jgi:hypothetical protein
MKKGSSEKNQMRRYEELWGKPSTGKKDLRITMYELRFSYDV